MQPSLFGELVTVPSPLCVYERACPRKGRAVLGDWEARGPSCRNRTITCLACPTRGEQSENLRIARKGTAA